MRKIVFFLTIAICLASCKKKPEFVLQGELQNCSSDEILVVYDDPVSKLDTIILKDGKFTYTFSPDTLTLFRLVSPDMLKTIPVFADKTLHMTLKGSFENPVISGDGENGVYGKFLESLQNLKDSAAITQKAEEFIDDLGNVGNSISRINGFCGRLGRKPKRFLCSNLQN